MGEWQNRVGGAACSLIEEIYALKGSGRADVERIRADFGLVRAAIHTALPAPWSGRFDQSQEDEMADCRKRKVGRTIALDDTQRGAKSGLDRGYEQ